MLLRLFVKKKSKLQHHSPREFRRIFEREMSSCKIESKLTRLFVLLKIGWPFCTSRFILGSNQKIILTNRFPKEKKCVNSSLHEKICRCLPVSWRRSAAMLRWHSSPTPSVWDRAWNPSRKTEKLPAIGQKSCWRKQPMKNGSMALLPKLSAGQRTAINC